MPTTAIRVLTFSRRGADLTRPAVRLGRWRPFRLDELKSSKRRYAFAENKNALLSSDTKPLRIARKKRALVFGNTNQDLGNVRIRTAGGGPETDRHRRRAVKNISRETYLRWSPASSWPWTRTATGSRTWPAVCPTRCRHRRCRRRRPAATPPAAAAGTARGDRRRATCHRRAHRVARSGRTAGRRAWRWSEIPWPNTPAETRDFRFWDGRV